MKTQRLYQTLILFAAVAASQVGAQTLDLGVPSVSPSLRSNIGTGDRNVVFGALQNFALTSAGIQIDPLTTDATPFTLTASLYSMTGPQTRGSLLTTGSLLFTGDALQFYDVPLSWSLVANQLYNIGFTVDGGWGFGRYNMGFYDFNYPGSPPFDVGSLVRVYDGGADVDVGFANTAMPHVELNAVAAATTVPEPGSMALLATGLIGVVGAARRRLRLA